MITIKEFAKLCQCSTQTLRYYDRIQLLKPQKVDDITGYRYYRKDQAIDFIKIKNFQLADFSIEEIKVLLKKTDEEIAKAFEEKILLQKQKLAQIKQIQQNYLKEKNSMEKLIQEMSDLIFDQAKDVEMMEEFGFLSRDAEGIIHQVKEHFQQNLKKQFREDKVMMRYNDQIITDADEMLKIVSELDLNSTQDTLVIGNNQEITEIEELNPAQFEVLYQKDGWDHVYEFIDEIPELENGGEYAFNFQLFEKDKANPSFVIFMIGIMLERNKGLNTRMGGTAEKSEDGLNHFQLLRKR